MWRRVLPLIILKTYDKFTSDLSITGLVKIRFVVIQTQRYNRISSLSVIWRKILPLIILKTEDKFTGYLSNTGLVKIIRFVLMQINI